MTIVALFGLSASLVRYSNDCTRPEAVIPDGC